MPSIAILIDAENVLPVFATQIFDFAGKMGDIIQKEIYGAAPALTSWVEPVLRYAMHPNLTIRASKGKNTSDIALVIGAMDLLVAHQVDTVVIASSDSDFSTLSVRLRSAGLTVIGMGTEKANPLWRTACSEFVTLEMPAHPQSAPAKPAQPKPTALKPAVPKLAAPRQETQPAPQPAQNSQPAAAKPAQPKPTHPERVAIIRARITEVLTSNGGKMLASTLFHTLNRLPEYRVDQQGSKRKPLNYLTALFGDTFYFGDTPGGMMISLTPVTKQDSLPQTPSEQTPSEQASPEQASPEQAPAGQTTSGGEAQKDAVASTDAPASADAMASADATASAEATHETRPQSTRTVTPVAEETPAAETGAPVETDDAPESAASVQAAEDRPIESLNLPARVRSALLTAGLKTAGDIARLSDSELLGVKSIGPAACRQIRAAIAE